MSAGFFSCWVLRDYCCCKRAAPPERGGMRRESTAETTTASGGAESSEQAVAQLAGNRQFVRFLILFDCSTSTPAIDAVRRPLEVAGLLQTFLCLLDLVFGPLGFGHVFRGRGSGILRCGLRSSRSLLVLHAGG